MQNQSPNIQFSPFIIGTMRLGEWGVKMSSQALERFIDECIDLGLKDFDHADIYGHYTEEGNFGRVIKRRPDLKSKIQITTKCGIKLVTPRRPNHLLKSYDSTKEHILFSAENSLKELGVEQLDVLLLHRPDYLMDPHEVTEAFSQLQKAGKVKAFGVSNFSTSQFKLLHQFFPLITNQIEISLSHRDAYENGTLDQCLQLGIRPTAWSPLAGGEIFKNMVNPNLIKIQSTLNILKEKHRATADQILYAWILKHPSGIIPILGTTKTTRIKSALKALKINLSHEDWYALWEAASGKEVA